MTLKNLLISSLFLTLGFCIGTYERQNNKLGIVSIKHKVEAKCPDWTTPAFVAESKGSNRYRAESLYRCPSGSEFYIIDYFTRYHSSRVSDYLKKLTERNLNDEYTKNH